MILQLKALSQIIFNSYFGNMIFFATNLFIACYGVSGTLFWSGEGTGGGGEITSIVIMRSVFRVKRGNEERRRFGDSFVRLGTQWFWKLHRTKRWKLPRIDGVNPIRPNTHVTSFHESWSRTTPKSTANLVGVKFQAACQNITFYAELSHPIYAT